MSVALQTMVTEECADRTDPVVSLAGILDGLSASAPDAEVRLAAALEAMETDSLDDFRAIEESAEHAERLAADVGRRDLQMRARLVRAATLIMRGDITTSGRIAQEAKEWATEHRHGYVLARSHLAVSSFRRHLGDAPDALAHAVECLAYTGDDVPAGIRARHLCHLAVTLCESGSLEEAYRRYREAFDVATAIGDLEMSLRLLNNQAYTAYKTGDREEARRRIEEMRAFVARHGIAISLPYLDTIARIELMWGRYAEVEEALRPILEGTQRSVDEHTLAESLVTVAEAQRLRGAVAEAQASLDRAVVVCDESELPSVRARVREEQARLFAVAGRFQEAYEEYEIFHAETQALLSAQREARARTLQAVFEADEARQESVRFREMAQRDPLTGLHNRRFVDEQLKLLLDQSAERGTPLSAALIDLDYFKRVNDTLSHAVGDAVLRQVADILATTATPSSVVARLGGEEFVLILPDTRLDEAVRHCERVRMAVANHLWQPVTGELPVTASIGVTAVAAGAATPSALLAQADRNLYAAKRSGRNRVVTDPA
ncbi:diguanylate cyclase [Actinoplanes sp. NPDC049118]|uniref:tetratricopeptide repeat-containing diguanylate cyclase n=1 Tax=Actinoplanes sp. NPDC049118 TaxID=3155769 RepID=UPI0034101CBD